MQKKFIVLLIIIFYFIPGLSASHQQKNIKKLPLIAIKTTKGTIIIELYPKKAPATVNNFLRYTKEKRWKGATFYRTVTLQNQPDNKIKIEVIQGGLKNEHDPQNLPPIPLETTKATGLHHVNGTISMARGNPNSATSEFFICIGNQPSLDYGGKRNPDGQGFAAFGKVIKGMDVVKKIQKMPAKKQHLSPEVKIISIHIINSGDD